MALHLLAQGAVVPRVYAQAAKTLGLRWCAAELDTTVRSMVEQLAATLPPDLVLHRQGRKQSPLPPGTQARVLLSALIDALLRRFAESSNEADKAQRSREDGKVRTLFFGAGQARLDGPGEGAIAGSIQNWLSRLHLGEQAHRPVLQIDEADDGNGFALSLAVVDERSRLDTPTPLATVLAQRGHLGGLTHFTREFATPIQTHRDTAAAARLRRVMAPFMVRRLKSDKSIISDLPDKLEQDQYCTLSREQAALYETVVREGLKGIAGESSTIQRQGLVLQMILALKQVCNHPAQYLKQGAADAAASGKAQRLLDLLDEIDAAQGKALVFTQFREMGDLLLRMLRERQAHGGVAGREALFLHGGVTRARRDEMVERFQNDPGQRVFVLSLKAGGTGLNLTAANHVVHFDLWWNPAVEAQATDRAYRIGQQRKVQVHRFITRGTFEERINEMIRSKRELAELTVGTGETWIGQLPPDVLKALFQLGQSATSVAAMPRRRPCATPPARPC
ncbi:MAG: DEAD/DEAH box helicase [Rubrivivax sp.]|nr:DEAD/DEAH box helicase [Rubrivivax sp.]